MNTSALVMASPSDPSMSTAFGHLMCLGTVLFFLSNGPSLGNLSFLFSDF